VIADPEQAPIHGAPEDEPTTNEKGDNAMKKPRTRKAA
jgi:hypothetical protein